MRRAAGRLGKMAAVLGVMMWAMGMTSAAEIASVIQIEGPPPQMDRLGERTDHQKEETQMTEGLGTNPGKEAAFGPGEVAASNRLGVDVSKLSGAADTDQMVVAVWTQEAAGTQTESENKTASQTQSESDKSFVKVAYFKKQENGTWTEIFCVPGFCGYNGVSFDKKEGDRQTPAGTFSFVKAFGILPNPGSHFPYKQLDSSDFWVDDSNSRYYNQMVSVNEVVPDWNSAENLSQIAPSYHYVLALDYNTTERVPGKGSAIFLHGYHTWKTWTEGCIAIPEENMKQLIQELKPEAKIVILPSLS